MREIIIISLLCSLLSLIVMLV